MHQTGDLGSEYKVGRPSEGEAYDQGQADLEAKRSASWDCETRLWSLQLSTG